MKWFEVSEDLGDGSSSVRRFKTKESATKYLSEYWEQPAEFGCHPFGDLEEVDTDSKYFWSDWR